MSLTAALPVCLRLPRLAFVGVVLMLAACASAPYYVAAERSGDVGYSEQKLENDRFRVSYTSRAGAGREEATQFALLRAAQLTLEEGRTWFDVLSNRAQTAQARSSGPRISLGGSVGSVGGRTATGVGVGLGFGGGGQSTAQTVVLEVRLGDGPKPQDAYTAASLAANLRASLPADAFGDAAEEGASE